MSDPTFFDGIFVGLLLAMVYCDYRRLISEWKADQAEEATP